MSKDNEDKCPVMHGSLTSNSASGTSNQDWWPNQLNLNILHQHDQKSDPLDCSFDYRLSNDTNCNVDFSVFRTQEECGLCSNSDYLTSTIDMGNYMGGFDIYESYISDHFPVLFKVDLNTN